MRSLWMGLLVLELFILPVTSDPTVSISPDYLYQNMPVVISYTGLSDGNQVCVGFDSGFTSQVAGSQGLTASSIALPFSLSPGTITSVDGRLFNSSQSFISDTNGTIDAGTYGIRVLKAVPTAGSQVNLSWMVNGTASLPDASGQVSFLPAFSPRQGILNVTTRFGSLYTSKLIPYNQSIAAPAVTASDVALIVGQTKPVNVSLTGLTNGLSLYNLTIRLNTGMVGNFTGVQVPSGVTIQSSSSLPASVITVNATANMAGSVNLLQALNLSCVGVTAGSSRINVTVNSLKDHDGASVSPVVITNGTLTVSPPPLPGAEFTGTPRSGIIPFNVSFLYTSPDSPNAFNWSFDDGTDNATTQNPTHTYWIAGSHDVNLTVMGASGNNTNVQPGYITARQVPIWFMGNVTSGRAPLSVSFNGSSSAPASSWLYYFGDGGIGASQNITHTYSLAGVYTVRAQAMMGSSRNVAVRNQYIRVT